MVTTSVGAPSRVIERRGVRIEDVGFTAKRATIGWPDEMPPTMPTGVVGREARALVAGLHLVGVGLAGQRRGGEAVADLDAFHGVDRHQRRGEVGVELAIERRAPAGRHALGHHLEHRADRRARLADVVEIGLEAFRRLGVGAEEGIAVHLRPVPARAVDRALAHRHERAANGHARHDLARDGAGSDSRRRFTR